jgi:aminoglycoside 2''-phosphotransferase
MSQHNDTKQIELTMIEETIRDNFPRYKIHSVKPLGEGWMSKAVLVNDEWVFRFPKKRDGADDLAKEIQIMPHLSDHITLAIPQFEYVGKQKNGLPFVGYKKLPGEILGEDAVPLLAEDVRNMIARQIAKFIDELSAFPIDQARDLGIPESDFRKDFLEAFEETKQKVYQLIDLDMQMYISSRFEAYLGNMEYFHYEPTLIHADLSPDHYLIDPVGRMLTGLIDFGDISIGDPDYEYLYILEDCGEDFTHLVMESRGQDKIYKKLEKIKYFVTFDQVATILEGVKRGNQNWIDEGIEAIRNEMMK